MEKKSVTKVVIEEEKKQKTPEIKATEKQKIICFYGVKNECGFCSNFYSAPIHVDGKTWPTTEHYFQAMKFPTKPEHQEKIRLNNNPAIAKRLG